MSRCFPFPPPGYEKKARPDQDANLLIKEDLKDKKQNKDKDKEKKEKREKSSEKQRERKEKKHRHKDKKEKKRDKEKNSSEERKIVDHLDHKKSEQVSPTGLLVGETQSSRVLLDLGKKVRNENGVKDTHIIERIRIPDLSTQSSTKAPELSNYVLAEKIQKFKDKKEENRIPNGHHVGAAGLANGFVSHFPAKDQKNVDGGGFQEVNVTEKQKEHKDTYQQKDTDGNGDKLKDGDREKQSKSKDKKRKREKEKEKKVNELSSSTPGKVREGGNNAVDCSNRGLTVSKESSSSRGTLDKRKEPEKDGFLNGNEIQSNKLLRPTPGTCQVLPTGNRLDVSNAGIRFPLEEGTGVRHKLKSKNSSSSPIIQNGMKMEMRQHAINITPEKQELVSNQSKASNRPVTPLKPAFGNGRNLEPCETVRSAASKEPGLVANPAVDKKAVPLHHIENGRKLQSSPGNNLSSVDRQGMVTKIKFGDRESKDNGVLGPKLDEKALKINGVVELKKQGMGAKLLEKPTSSGQQNISEMHVKPPHPDVKYLDNILSIPKVEWSDVDDQTWLFSQGNHLEAKPRKVSMIIEEPKQVWAEAMHIESADVTALPYVIRY